MGTATMTASSARSREGKQRSEGEGGPESEGEVRGGRGCVASREGPGKEEAARQGGGGLLGRARASTQLLRDEGEEDDWQLGCTVTGRAGGLVSLVGLKVSPGKIALCYFLFSIFL